MPKTLMENIVIEEVISPPHTSGPDTYEVVVSVRPRSAGAASTGGNIFSIGTWDYDVSQAKAEAGGTDEDFNILLAVAEELSMEAGNRGTWTILKAFGLSQDKILADTSLAPRALEGKKYTTTDPLAQKDFEVFLSDKDGSVSVSSPMWISPRPKDSDPFRLVVSVTISKEKLIELQADLGDPTVVVPKAISNDEPEEKVLVIDRALPKFRQTFNNVIEFEDLIGRVAGGLKKYDKKLSKSYFKYNRPPPGTSLDRSYSSDEIDKWPELSFKRDAADLQAAGDKIVSFLRSKGHATAAPFEIGFQEYYQRDVAGDLTKKLKEDVERGIIPGIIYVGRVNKATDGVNIYTPYVLKNQFGGESGIDEGLNIPWKHAKDSLDGKIAEGDTWPPHVWGSPQTKDTNLPFTKPPLANHGTRWYLANLREIGYKAIGGKPSPEELKMQAQAAAATSTLEAAKDPCNMTAPGVSQKEPMPVDEFIERYVFPQPEKSFDKGSLMDLAKSLAGWHSGDEASQHRQTSRSLTTESALQFLINESSTNLSDYIGDMVWKNMPRAPNKIRSVHDAYAYILGGIDIPTLVIKLLECLGLMVSLEDLIDWICDEIIRTVGAEYGVDAIVQFIMEDGFEIPGEYIDVSHQELMDPLQNAASDQVNTGSDAADQMLTSLIDSPNEKKIKRIICLVIALGPFAAVAALIWLLNHLLFAEESLDEKPAKKKCDISFSMPDEWPIWDAIWDFIVRMAKKRLEEEAMRMLEEEVIKPLRELIWQILDFCDDDDTNKYGQLPLEALVGFEKAAAPLFLGQDANDFLKRLLASLTPGELCMLVRGTEPVEAPRMQKVLKFIMDFAADPENDAPPFTVIAEKGGPGTLGNGENVIQFFRSLDGKVDTSICDRPDLPDEPIVKLCDDIGSNYEQTLREALQQRGLSEEKINEQVNLKKQSDKEALGSAVKHLLRSSNSTEKVQQDTKKIVQNILVESMEASNSSAVKAIIEGAGGSMKADVGKFATALLDAPFLKRIVAGIDSMKEEKLFLYEEATPPMGVSSYHKYRFNIFDAEYLEQKAVEMERGGGATSECDEIKRHIKLMEDLQSYMVQDLFDARYKYWDGEVFYELKHNGIFNEDDKSMKKAGDDAANAAAEAAGYIGSGKSGSAYRIYNKFGTGAGKKRQIIEASWFNLPHKRLIERYNNLTPQEFDDLATIAFRFYSRYILDYDILGEEPQEKDLRLRSDTKYFSSFYYNPLTFEGGPHGWLPKVIDYNFRMGGSRPWRYTEPGPDTTFDNNPTPNISVLLAKLNKAQEFVDKGYYITYTSPPKPKVVKHEERTRDQSQPGGYRTTTHEKIVFTATSHLLPRTDWVPKDTRWSVNDLKTVLVQLLVFVWDIGKDNRHDFPYYQGNGKFMNEWHGTEKAWEKNFFGGHLMRALSFYKWGYYDLYGFTESKSESKEIILVEAEWAGSEAIDTLGYWNGWVPKKAYIDPETLEPILPDTMWVNRGQWEEGHGGNSLTPKIATSDEQIMIVDPATGKRAGWIPAPQPSPKRIFCNPDLDPPPGPPPEPVYEATYKIFPTQKANYEPWNPLDKDTECITDDYLITVVKPGDPNGDLLNYRSTELLKLWDGMGHHSPDGQTPGYYLAKTKEVLEKNWQTGPGWDGFRTLEPIAPQLFERMVMRQISGQGDIAGKLPSFDSSMIIDEDDAHGAPTGKSLSHSLKDILSERKQGRKHLYGTAFRSILRDLSELSLKYGIADKARGDFDTVHEKVIAGVAAALQDINTGVDSLIDLNDVSKDAANKHKASMADSDLSDLSTVPTIGKTLISYPPDPIIKRVKNEDDLPDEIVIEEVDWSKGPAIIRLLVRVGIMERVFKSIITSAAFDTELSFGSGPMKALLSKLIGDSIGKELGDKIKIVASDLNTIKDDPSIYEAIMPLVDHESKTVADKVAGVLAGSGEPRIPDLAEFLRDKVYDLARCHPDSNLYSTNDDLAEYFPLKYEAANPEDVEYVKVVDPVTGEATKSRRAARQEDLGLTAVIRMEAYGVEKDISIENARKQLAEHKVQIQEVKLAMNEIVAKTSGEDAAQLAKYHLTNNLHALPRFFNDRGEQEASGFILEKYIKIKFKSNLKETIKDKNLSKQFFDAWANYLPIEHRGNPVAGWLKDGEKFPAYLNPEEFTEAIGNFFTYFGNMNPKHKAASVFDWAQLFDPEGFNERLQELSDKVYNDGEQCYGDKEGYDSLLNITRDARDLVSNGSKAAQMADFLKDNDIELSAELAEFQPDDPKKMVVSRSAEIQRHIALMERLLEFQLKDPKLPAEFEGYVEGGSGRAEDDAGKPFNIPPGLRSLEDEPYGMSHSSNDNDPIPQTVKQPPQIGDFMNVEYDSPAGGGAKMYDFDFLTPQEKRDLETIAFRFYSRYHFGDLTAFYFDPHDTDKAGFSKFPKRAQGNLYDFVKRKGFLDKTVDFRTGLRRPGPMWKHAVDQTEGGKTMKGMYPVPQPNDPRLNLHIPTTLIDLIKMVDMQLRWRDKESDPNSGATNWGISNNPKYDGLCGKGTETFDIDVESQCPDPAYMVYNTSYIQKDATTTQWSLKIPNLASNYISKFDWLHEDERELFGTHRLTANPVGQPIGITTHNQAPFRTSAGLKYKDPIPTEILRSMAKLLCYPYELGDFQRSHGNPDAAHDKYTIPWDQRWTKKDTKHKQDINWTEGGLHTDATIGENWTALFGGHLYWALQYYKKGLWESTLDFISSDTHTPMAAAPSPLGIFTMDSSENSTIIKIPGATPPDLESLKDKPLTGPNGFADVDYGLRLSYVVPQDKSSSSWRRYPLSAIKNGGRQGRESFWGTINDTLKAMWQPGRDAGDAWTDSTSFDGQTFNFQTNLKIHAVDTYDAMKREKSFFMKEVGEFIPEATGGEGIGHKVIVLPILEHNVKADDGLMWNDIKYDEDKFGDLFSQMKEKDDFKLLFSYVVPLQRAVAILSIRDMLNFEQSLEITPYDKSLFGISQNSVIELLKWAFDTSKDYRVSPTPLEEIIKIMEEAGATEADLKNLTDQLSALTVPEPSE